MTKVTLPDKPPRWWWWWQRWLWALALVISSTHTKRPSSATFELVFVSLFLPNLLSNAFPFPPPNNKKRHFFHLIDDTQLDLQLSKQSRKCICFLYAGLSSSLCIPESGAIVVVDDESPCFASPRLASSRLVHYICTIRNVCAQFGYPILAALSLWIVYSLAKGMSGPESHACFHISLIALMRI